MAVKIKTAEEIEKMRVAGKLASEILEMIEPHIQVGTTTEELNQICHEYATERGAYSAPLDYHGFPKSICTSINHIVCHGIPASQDETGSTGQFKPAVLKDGDILNVDITVIIPDDENADLSVRPQGYHGDTSKMFLVGEVSPANKRLCMVAQEALYEGMRQVKPGVQLGQIGTAIEKYIKTNNKNNPRAKFSIVKDYCGHGIGSEFHEDPQVVHYLRGYSLTLAFNRPNHNCLVSYQLDQKWCGIMQPMKTQRTSFSRVRSSAVRLNEEPTHLLLLSMIAYSFA